MTIPTVTTERLKDIASDVAMQGYASEEEQQAIARELLAVREAKPYGYLRENDDQVQLSIGPEQPPNRSGGYATPWQPIYAAPAAPTQEGE